MKFQRRLSQPHVVLLQEPLVYRPAVKRQRRLVWSDFWASVVKLVVGSAEPVIEEQRDRNGQVSYTIHDPTTQQQVHGLSEQEARIWLEQRYYQ